MDKQTWRCRLCGKTGVVEGRGVQELIALIMQAHDGAYAECPGGSGIDVEPIDTLLTGKEGETRSSKSNES